MQSPTVNRNFFDTEASSLSNPEIM